MKKSLLYIVNFYGSPPLNYFEKYIKETNSAYLTVIKLPSIRSAKNRLTVEAFIKDEKENIFETRLDYYFPFPYFLIFFIQYIINFFLLFHLLRKIKRTHFDIAIGETNFGSTLVYILKKLGKITYSVYFNGDILPDPSTSNNCFFLPNTHSKFSRLMKRIDTFILRTQAVLRKIGYKNDMVWYGNNMIKTFDDKMGLKSKDSILYDPILIDYGSFLTYEKKKRDMNSLCYIGRIDDYVGLDLIIKALPLLQKKLEGITLHIIGGSTLTFEKYKQLAITLGIQNAIIFHGYIPDMRDALDIMSNCALGLALYKPDPSNVSMYSQPAKPKEYIKVGLPILVTKGGPLIGKEIVKYKAGVESEFEIDSVYKNILEVLTNKNLYSRLQKGVKEFAKKNHYFNTFAKVWSILEISS